MDSEPVRIMTALTDTAKIILEKRYLQRDDQGTLIESPEQLFRRVAVAVAEAEPVGERTRRASQFESLMASLQFLPNSPTLMNAGLQGTLSACFVLVIPDSLEGILETAALGGQLLKYGGGVGYGLSSIRAKGTYVNGTGGKACGPVAVLRHLQSLGAMVQQAGKRDGAHMAILHCRHPDIEAFVNCKRENPDAIYAFNISVALTDEFMQVTQDPSSSESQLLVRMAEGAWATGDPGCFFIDQANATNPTPHLGPLECTNPCGESPLYSAESCNLGSLNVARFAHGASLDWARFEEAVALALRFLDDVISINHYAHDRVRKATLATRKVGLGIMGWADLLDQLRIPYATEEAVNFGCRLMERMAAVARRTSEDLAREREPYPALAPGSPVIRNATCTAIAPTGTIALLAGCSPGIEPHFLLNYQRRMADGTLFDIEEGTAADSFRSQTAHEITPKWHLRHQAAFQEFTDLAVSKTINLPTATSPLEIYQIYKEAWTLRCKGVTVYRDGCRENQVLSATPLVPVEREAVPPVHRKRQRLPPTRQAITHKFSLGGEDGYITIGFYESGKPGEVFLTINKEGAAVRGWADVAATFLSLALQYGMPLETAIEKLRYSRFEPAGMTGNPAIPLATSVPDYLAHFLETQFQLLSKHPSASGVLFCPDCGNAQVTTQEGCYCCGVCGWARC